MKYFIIAGEASGDLHASNMIKALTQIDNEAEIQGWGGDLMDEAGTKILKHYNSLAFMGFVEVLMNLGTIMKNFRECKKQILDFNPDIVVFIDYPGFNLRMARWAKNKGFKTHYYIAPQVWAWKESRVKSMKENIEMLSVILPFEKDFFEKKHQFKCHFVGHPLLDALQKKPDLNFRLQHQIDPNKPLIALLPGSRKQELKRMLPIMLDCTNSFPNHEFVIAVAPGQDLSFYETFIAPPSDIKLVQNQTYALLAESDAALVTSGTATLETALFDVPQLVCYKTSSVSFAIAKKIVKLPYISLVNLIMDRFIVEELIQENCTTRILVQKLNKILNPIEAEKFQKNYSKLRKKLGGIGASEKVAKLIFDQAKQ